MWCTDYFDRAYLKRWRLGLPDQEIKSHAEALLKRIAGTGGWRLLDVGCGQGRYALAFASLGLWVTGLDRSVVLLKQAQRQSGQAGYVVRWVRADMRAIPFRAAFDYATLLDSFGFFETEKEDQGVIEEIVAALRPGGILAIAVANGLRIRMRFRPVDNEVWGGASVKIDRQLVDGGRLMQEQLTVNELNGVSTFDRMQRLYSREELVKAVAEAGLTSMSIFGDLLGTEFDETGSGKIVLLAKKE